MAELSYDDVRRAAQDALRDIHNVVYGLQNSHNDIRRTLQNGSNNQYQLNDIATRLSMVQQQVNLLTNAMRSPTAAQPNSIQYNIQQSVNDLQRRLVNIEQFVQVCYRYFEALQKQDEEDDQFQSA